MKTYKVESVKATSLRKQLLWANIASFFAVIAAFAFGLGGAVSGEVGTTILAGAFGIIALVTTLWSVVAYWRALWALWEWQGVGMGFAVALAVVVLNTLAAPTGAFGSLAFLVYVYMQLGKQSGEVSKTSREIFSE